LNQIKAYARNDLGRVDLASVPSFARSYLPDLLVAFNHQYPQVSLNIRDDSSENIHRLLTTGEVDIGIASPISEIDSEISCIPLLADPIEVVCSELHGLSSVDRLLCWEDIANYKFIANGTCRRIRHPEFQNILSNAEIVVHNTTSILSMVRANLGITTLPRLAIPENQDGVVVKPTIYSGLLRNIGILTPKNRTLSPAASAFIELVTQTVTDEKK
jgi:DNA-binding transcriptional LysR family regulator